MALFYHFPKLKTTLGRVVSEYKKRVIVLATAYFCLAAIISADELNCCVRDGNGCDPLGIATEKLLAQRRLLSLI